MSRTGSPRVSVVMPFLNAQRFLAESVESVIAQEFTEWELLLVDDGSSDSSPATARSFASRDNRIKYLSWPDGATHGASAARNLAIKNARGEYIAFLDSDDIWLPGNLAHLVAALDAHPQAGSAYTNTLFWYSWDGSPGSMARDYLPRLGVPTNSLMSGPDLITACWEGTAAVPCTCGLLVRRQLVQDIGGFEEQFRIVFTDQAFYTKLFIAAPVFVLAGCWSWYRLHSSSSVATSEKTGRLHQHRVAYLKWSADYVQKHAPQHSAAASALSAELRWNSSLWLYKAREGSRSVRRVLKALPRHLMDGASAVARGVRHAGGAPRQPNGAFHFGPLHQVTPVSREYGFDRGTPIDRYYIETFLTRNAPDVTGKVLEIGDDHYTRRFGGSRVKSAEILHVDRNNPRATYVGDLSVGDTLPTAYFDCIILTQTLHLIYDMPAAVRTLHRILKPGGVCLATSPGISQLEAGEWRATWCWSLTEHSAQRLFGEVFGPGNVHVESRGNVLAACAFLQGLASEELHQAELDHHDPLYPVSILIRAVRAAG